MSDLGIEFEEDNQGNFRRSKNRHLSGDISKPKMVLFLNRYGLNDNAAQGVLIATSILFFAISGLVLFFHFIL